MITQNKPYVKKYENGILANPITKDNPYNSGVSTKREKKFRKLSNTQGFGLLIIRIGKFTFQKYHKQRQLAPNGNVIEHLIAV